MAIRRKLTNKSSAYHSAVMTRLTRWRRRKVVRLMEMQKDRCCYCGCVMRHPYDVDQGRSRHRSNDATLEHFIPYHIPVQTNKDENLYVACTGCNNTRGSLDPMAFYAKVQEFIHFHSKTPTHHNFIRDALAASMKTDLDTAKHVEKQEKAEETLRNHFARCIYFFWMFPEIGAKIADGRAYVSNGMVVEIDDLNTVDPIVIRRLSRGNPARIRATEAGVFQSFEDGQRARKCQRRKKYKANRKARQAMEQAAKIA